MKKKYLLLLCLTLAMALVLSACRAQTDTQSTLDGSAGNSGVAFAVGERVFGDFTATDLDGVPVDQSLFTDHKLTMVNIWATYCSPCLSEMPDLGELHQSYADQGFQVVGIVLDTLDQQGEILPAQVDTARQIADQTGAAYTHLLPSEDLITAKLKNVTGVPETLFLNGEGKIVGKAYLGARSYEQWQQIIEQMLSEVS